MNEETRHTKVIIGLGGCKLEIDLDTGGGRFISAAPAVSDHDRCAHHGGEQDQPDHRQDQCLAMGAHVTNDPLALAEKLPIKCHGMIVPRQRLISPCPATSPTSTTERE